MLSATDNINFLTDFYFARSLARTFDLKDIHQRQPILLAYSESSIF